MIDKIVQINNEFKEKVKSNAYKIVVSIVIIIITIIIAKIIKNNILNKIVEKEDNSNKNKILYTVIASFVYYIIIFIGIVIALINLGYQLSTIFIVLGSVGLAIALAIQGTITQIVSGFVILFFSYFNIGDLILCNGVNGYVTDFNLLSTTLTDFSGVKVLLPNSSFTSSPFTNYTANRDVFFKLYLTLSSNNSIDFDILLNNIKNSIINESKYVTDKSKVSVVIFDIQSTGTTICINVPIRSINYVDAGFDSRLIVRRILAQDNVLLLDNNYIANSRDISYS
jgi:small conductance mechanosensitive channel